MKVEIVFFYADGKEIGKGLQSNESDFIKDFFYLESGNSFSELMGKKQRKVGGERGLGISSFVERY